MIKVKGIIHKLKNNKLFRDYIWVFLGQNLGSVFTTLSIIVTLKIINTEDYGALTVIQTYCLLISNIFALRTFNGIIKFSTEAEKDGTKIETKKYINSAILLDVVAGAVAFVAAFLLINPVTSFMGWEPSTVRFVRFYIPVILFYPILNGAPIGVLRKLGHFKQVNIVHASVYGAQLLTLCVLYVLGIHDFKVVLIDYAITEIIETVVVSVLAYRVLQRDENYRGFWRAGFSKDKEFYKYNFYYGLMLSFDQILTNVSTLIVNKYAGNLVTAYLKIITKICSLITKLTNPISQVFYPKLCEWITKKEYKKSLKTCYAYLGAVLGLGSFVGLILFSTYNWWVPIFDAGMTSAKLQSILYFSFSLLSVSIICFQQLSLTLDMMRYNLITVIVCDLAYLALLVPCVKQFGVNGYLLLQIAQLLCVFFMKYIMIRKKIHKAGIIK